MEASELLGGLIGILLGVILLTTIQVTIGNPFLWWDERLRERRYKKYLRDRKEWED